jgi:hypothetical protein
VDCFRDRKRKSGRDGCSGPLLWFVIILLYVVCSVCNFESAQRVQRDREIEEAYGDDELQL